MVTTKQMDRGIHLMARSDGDFGGRAQFFVRRKTPLTLASLGLVTLAAGLPALALPLVVGLFARLVPAATVIRRTALAVLAILGLNAAVLTVLAVAGLAWHLPRLLAVYLILAALIPKPPSAPSSSADIAGHSDRWALGAALATFALLYGPFAWASTGRIMALLSYGSDSATHLSLVLDIRQYDGFITLRRPPEGLPGMADYPGAWAGNVAMMVQLVLGDNASIPDFMRIVAPFIVAMYALLVFFAVAVSLDNVLALRGRISKASGLVACLCLGLTTIVGVNVFLLQGGFYTQSLATTCLLSAISLHQTERSPGIRQLIMLGLLTITLMHSWYLLAPVMAVILLVHVLTERPRVLFVTGVALPTGLLSAYPVIMGPTSAQINAPGPSPLPTIGGIIGLLLVTLAGLVYLLRVRGRGRQQRLALVAALVATLGLVVGILIYQSQTAAGFNYYLFKLFYTIFLLGSVAGTAAAVAEFDRVRNESSRFLRPVAMIAVVVIGLSVGSYTTRSLSWPYARGETPPRIDGRSLDALFATHPTGLPEGVDTWMLDGCERVSDHIASKWVYDLSLSWDTNLHETYQEFAVGYDDPVDVGMLVRRAQDPQVTRMEVYVHEDCSPEAWRALQRQPKVVVIHVP